MKEEYHNFYVEKKEGIGWITFNLPDKMNSVMDNQFYTDFQKAIKKLDADEKTKVIIMIGEGKAFCTGGDIKYFAEMESIGEKRDYLINCFNMFKSIEGCSKPVIAAVNGYALGGGTELAMASDIAIAAEEAKMGTPEITLGLMPGYAVIRGRDLIGKQKMKYLAFTGEKIDAEKAKEWGIVTKTFPKEKLREKVTELAETIMKNGPLGAKIAKAFINRGFEEGYSYTIEATTLLHSTEDRDEGIQAFIEKRKPEFEGK